MSFDTQSLQSELTLVSDESGSTILPLSRFDTKDKASPSSFVDSIQRPAPARQILCLLAWVLGEFFVEILFLSVAVVTWAELNFVKFAIAHPPVDPRGIKKSTLSRLYFLENYNVSTLVVLLCFVVLFQVSGRGRNWSVRLIIAFGDLGLMIWTGEAIAQAWGYSEEGIKLDGLRCTYGLSTPMNRLCSHIRDIRGMTIAQLVLQWLIQMTILLYSPLSLWRR